MRNPSIRIATAGVCTFLAAGAAGSANAQEKLLPPDAQIEQAVRAVWLNGGNRRPLCASPGSLRPDQQGFQELQQAFVPGQWVVRFAHLPQRRAEIAQHDFLARSGFLERREAFINLGPMQGLPAVEYRATDKGWARNASTGDPPRNPCIHYGIAQVLRVLGYSESEKDQAGFSRVEAHYLAGADLEDWANTPEAAELFLSIKQAREGRKAVFNFYRGPDGKLRISRNDAKTIDELRPRDAPAEPGIEGVEKAIQRARELATAKPSLAVPIPCLPMLSKHMPQLWKEGDGAAASQAILRFPEARSTAREVATLAYARLRRLEQAGLVRLRGDAQTGQVIVVPSQSIQPLLEKHGNCLPLGNSRLEVAGLLPDHVRGGGRQRFKARYVVEEPADWIKQVKNTTVLADLGAALRYGQPLEGAFLNMSAGWMAGYFEDRRPSPTSASLSAVGVSPDWKATSETTIAAASVVNHELHVVDAYGARAKPVRIEVLVKPSTRPVLILLTGYELIEWHFNLERGAKVNAVLAVGYHEQRVVGLPASTAVVTASQETQRPDLTMTRLGSLDRKALVASLGVEATSTQQVEGEKVIVGGPKGATQ